MLKAVDGFTWQDADGKFNLMVGRFEMPTVTLTDDHIKGTTATRGPGAMKRVGAIKVCSIPRRRSAIASRKARRSPTPPRPRTRNHRPPGLRGLFCAASQRQAARVGKLALTRLGADRWHISGLTNLHGLNILGQRFVRVESASLGVAGYFMVIGLRLNLGDNTVEGRPSTREKPEDWDFQRGDRGRRAADRARRRPPPPPLAAPTGLTLAAVQIAAWAASTA